AGHADQPGAGGQGGELSGETGQQCRVQVFFLRGPEVVHGAGELGYRAAGGAPHKVFQPMVGKPGGRRRRQRPRELGPAGIGRRGHLCDWYREMDLLPDTGETVIGAASTLDDPVRKIMRESGLDQMSPIDR
ncbi:hypothetical protein AB0911_37705, partial [Streptomyces nigra]